MKRLTTSGQTEPNQTETNKKIKKVETLQLQVQVQVELQQ